MSLRFAVRAPVLGTDQEPDSGGVEECHPAQVEHDLVEIRSCSLEHGVGDRK